MHIRMAELSKTQFNALRVVEGKTGVVAKLDPEQGTATFEGSITQVVTAIQSVIDEIRETDGNKAQNYRSLVGIRNRFEAEKDLAEANKSKTVEILPNGANVAGEIPGVLAGVPVVNAGTEKKTTRANGKGRGAADKGKAKEATQNGTQEANGVLVPETLPTDAPTLTATMRENFAYLARAADTDAARKYWGSRLEALSTV